MMIKKRQKRKHGFISTMLAISLLGSMLMFETSYAEPTDTPLATETPISTEQSSQQIDIKRKLYIDYLGIDDNPAETHQGLPRLIDAWEDVGFQQYKIFWIGVAVDKINDLDLFKQGVFSLEIGFDYDSDYVEPYTTNEKTWTQFVEEANLAANPSPDNNYYWNSVYYKLDKVLTNADIVTDVDREDCEKAQEHKQANWKMCYVHITPKTNSLVERRFKNITDEGKQYLIRLPFRLKKIPEDSTGKMPIVLNLTRGPTTFVIGSDDTGVMPYASWKKTIQNDSEEDDHNLKTMFRFGGEIDIFSENEPMITDISVNKGNLEEEETAQQYNLYHDKNKDTSGFEILKTDYYVEVPNETESIEVKITAGSQPYVRCNSSMVHVETDGANESKFKTNKIMLNAFNPDEDIGELEGVDVSFEKNVIEITINDETFYKLHVKRLPAEPVHDDQDIGLKVTKGDPEEDLTLTANDYTTPKDFVADDNSEENPNEYWVRVNKDTDTVKIHVTAGSGYTVTIDDEDAELTDGIATREITNLKPVIEKNEEDGTLKKDDDGNVIINGTKDVVVTVGTNTYTVHIQRLGDGGGIDLNPGNSPYAMIERMRAKYHGTSGAWTTEQIEAVKNKLFDYSNATPAGDRYKFANKITMQTSEGNTVEIEALPDHAETSNRYHPKAWGTKRDEPSYDSKYNLDMDDNALFIYQKKAFVDPGFTLYDESGNIVDLSKSDNITVTTTVLGVNRMAGSTMQALDPNNTGKDEVLSVDENGVVKNLTASKINIRPDVYTMQYTITGLSATPITATRNLILLPNRYDINLDGSINTSDSTIIKAWADEVDLTTVDDLPVRIQNLYLYRVLDDNSDGSINTSDSSLIKAVVDEIDRPLSNLYIMFNREGEIYNEK